MNRSAGTFSQAHRTFAANELTQSIGFRKGNDLSIEISNGATSAGVMPPLHGLHSAQTNGILLRSERKLGGCEGLERCWLETNEASNLFSRVLSL